MKNYDSVLKGVNERIKKEEKRKRRGKERKKHNKDGREK